MDGLDEISTIGRTKLAWFRDGDIVSKEIMPQDLGLKLARPDEVSGFDVDQSARLMVNILNGEQNSESSRLQMVLANAAAAILVGGKADDLASGVELARELIVSGRAYDKLKGLVEFTNGDATKLERIIAQIA